MESPPIALELSSPLASPSSSPPPARNESSKTANMSQSVGATAPQSAAVNSEASVNGRTSVSGGLFVNTAPIDKRVNVPFSFGRVETPPKMSMRATTRGSSESKRVEPSIRKQSSSAPTYGNTCLAISVGSKDSAVLFTIHKELAYQESAFIKAALRHDWQESKQGVIYLPDHDPEHFRLFQLWVYNRSIFSAKTGEADKIGGTEHEWDRLASAWALGSYLQAPDFRDAVVDAIIDKATTSTNCTQNMHEIIYPNSQANAPIRKLLADIASWRWDRFTLNGLKKEASWADFFYDLSGALIARRDSFEGFHAPLRLKHTCSYHEHSPTGSTCHKTKYT